MDKYPHILATLFFLLKFSRCADITCTELDGTVFENIGALPVPECFVPEYNLFTRADKENGVQISRDNVPSVFANDKRTIMIIHGYRDYPEYADGQGRLWMHMMKDALLVEDDLNVILTNWSIGGYRDLSNFVQAAANARVAGKAVSLLFDQLVSGGLAQYNSHCIGHSLGAHVCGYAGKWHKFGRISGLDPAGPEFETLTENYRLSEKDANFVDCIHTDGGGNYYVDYGTLINFCEVDFYPNGGQWQTGCVVNKKEMAELEVELDLDEKEIEILEEVERNLWSVSCSHSRAYWLYIESIGSSKCVSKQSCTDYNNLEETYSWWWGTIPSSCSYCSSCSSCDTCSTCASCKSCVCQEMGYRSILYQNTQGSKEMYYLTTSAGPEDTPAQDYCLG